MRSASNVRMFGVSVLVLLLCASAALAVNSPPTVGTPSPSSGILQTGQWTTITCAYSDADGATNLWMCQFLINNVIANNGGAHFMYNRNENKLYMKNNSNAVVGGVTRGTATTIQSENAILDCAGTTVTVSGNNITITWRFQIKTTMAGKTCNLYALATDNSGGTYPWTVKGQVSINIAPTVGTPSPNSGVLPTNQWTTMTCTYTDLNGRANLATGALLINNVVANVGGAHFIFDRNANKFYMKNNASAVIPPLGVVRGTATTIQSENAILDCAGTTIAVSTNSMTITWRFQIKSTMIGKNCNLYVMASDNSGGMYNWTKKGAVRVNSVPVANGVAPSSGTLSADSWKTFTCVYSDADGAGNLATCNLLINSVVANLGGAHFVFYENNGKLQMKNNASALIPAGGVSVGAAQFIESENAILDCGLTTVSKSGNMITVNWCVMLKPVMVGTNHKLFMTATDDLGATPGWLNRGAIVVAQSNLAVLISSGKDRLNQAITMDPYDPVAARLLIEQARDYFTQARALAVNDSQANFGLAITTAALTGQDLVDKYQPIFESDGGGGGLAMVGSSLAVWNLRDSMDSGKSPLDGYVSAQVNAVRLVSATADGVDLEDVLDMQTDLRDVVIPMFNSVGAYLSIVEQDPAFEFEIGPFPGLDPYVIVDVGDVYIFHGVLLGCKSILALPVSYSLNYGSYDFNLDAEDRDRNHDGILTRDEWLPASPFGTLIDPILMAGIKPDALTACDKVLAGISATLAETSDDYELIPWHTRDSGITRSALIEAQFDINRIKAALTTETMLQIPDGDGGYRSVTVNLGAWSDNPPLDLTMFVPELEAVEEPYWWAVEYYGISSLGMLRWMPVDGSYPDVTLGGLFPDGQFEPDLYDTAFFEDEDRLFGTTTVPANRSVGVSKSLSSIRIDWQDIAVAVEEVILEKELAPGAWQPVPISPIFSGDTYSEYSVDVTLSPNTWYRITGKAWYWYRSTSYFRTGL